TAIPLFSRSNGGSAEPHSKPIICPRPPQTRAAPFKSLYRKRAGQRFCHSGDWSRRRASDTALRLVAVSKARRAAFLPLRRLVPSARFRYSPKTSGESGTGLLQVG